MIFVFLLRQVQKQAGCCVAISASGLGRDAMQRRSPMVAKLSDDLLVYTALNKEVEYVSQSETKQDGLG